MDLKPTKSFEEWNNVFVASDLITEFDASPSGPFASVNFAH